MKEIQKQNKAIIYCRVSSERQVREGDGLRSQETRCREYAERRGFKVMRVFKDEGISGGLGPDMRPATKELFAFLDTQKDSVTVIVDGVSRVARSQSAFIEFSAQLTARGARLASPSHKFGSKSDEMLITEIMVSMASYQRVANREQVINRQTARLKNGYWLFGRPSGYRYVKNISGAGKILERDEPRATYITEAFEGFASGRFETQADVAHFLASTGAFGKKVHPSSVKNILTNVLYTGQIEYKPWDVSLRPGKHPALISSEIFLRVQERLGLRAKVPYRNDLNEDFPLRGFVVCSSCGQPMTASWSTGRNKKKHPYYSCKNKECRMYGKSLKRDRVQNQFLDILKSMTPSDTILDLTREIISDTWKRKKSEHAQNMVELDKAVKALETEINGFMARLLETQDKDMIRMYEDHVKKLRLERDALSAQAREMFGVDTSLEGAVGTVFDFIENPLSIWENGDFEDKRLVLKLAFAKKIPYCKENGFGTAAMSLPFKVLKDFEAGKSKMVVCTVTP